MQRALSNIQLYISTIHIETSKGYDILFKFGHEPKDRQGLQGETFSRSKTELPTVHHI